MFQNWGLKKLHGKAKYSEVMSDFDLPEIF